MLDKVLSYVLIIVLVLPLGIGFSHSIKDHENDICIAEKEKHIHTQKVNCSYLHYFTNVQNLDQELNFSALISNFIYSEQISSLENFYFLSHSFALTVRGPPTINAF